MLSLQPNLAGVLGVFDDSVDLEELENTFPESGEYVITFRMVEKNLEACK